MITRCYLEITNVCNLNCVFCPKTERAKHTLTLDEFDALTSRLEGEVKFLYFHLMGEPFLHPLLPQFVLMARRKGFVPVITTNGTLLSRRPDLLDALPHKIQISLHSHEGNAKENLAGYVDGVMVFAQEAARRGCVVVLRLWNEGGHNSQNAEILDMIAQRQPRPWAERHDGWRLAENLFVRSEEHTSERYRGAVLSRPQRRHCAWQSVQSESRRYTCLAKSTCHLRRLHQSYRRRATLPALRLFGCVEEVQKVEVAGYVL